MKKGQALVEFIIILPVFIFLLLGVIDIGHIMYTKINLENTISEATNLYENHKPLEEIESKLNTKIKLEEQEDIINIYVSKKINIITPGFNLIFGNPYTIEVKRSILNE